MLLCETVVTILTAMTALLLTDERASANKPDKPSSYKIAQQYLKYMHKTVDNTSDCKSPWYLADHVAMTSSVCRRRNLRSVETLALEVPRTRLSFGDRALSVAGHARQEQSSHKLLLCPVNVLF